MQSQDAYFEGDRGVIVLCTMFLVSSSINVSIFHITWLDTSRTDFVYVFLFNTFTFFYPVSQTSSLLTLVSLFRVSMPIILFCSSVYFIS